MTTPVALAAGFGAGFAAAVVVYMIFREQLAEYVANRHLDRARTYFAAGDTDRATAELKKLAHNAIPPDLVGRMTSRQLTALYKESGLEERVKRFMSVFEDVDDGRKR